MYKYKLGPKYKQDKDDYNGKDAEQRFIYHWKPL